MSRRYKNFDVPQEYWLERTHSHWSTLVRAVGVLLKALGRLLGV